MKKAISIILIGCCFLTLTGFEAGIILNDQRSLPSDTTKFPRTDGYYYTIDTLTNTTTKEIQFRFYPIVFFEDSSFSDFYGNSTQEGFEKHVLRKNYKWIKRFSKFGHYNIDGDSIFLKERTYENRMFEPRGKLTDAALKGIIVDLNKFLIVENIYREDTLKFSAEFFFKPCEFKNKK